MGSRLITFVNVAVHTFVPWVVVLFLLTLLINLPRAAFISVHYIASVLIFAIAFHYFYNTHPDVPPFHTTVQSLIAFGIFEVMFLTFFSTDHGRFLNYIDWIFPTFLIATTIYAVGKKG